MNKQAASLLLRRFNDILVIVKVILYHKYIKRSNLPLLAQKYISCKCEKSGLIKIRFYVYGEITFNYTVYVSIYNIINNFFPYS